MAYSTARTVISLWQLLESVSGTACDLMGRPEGRKTLNIRRLVTEARHQKVLIPLFNEWLTNSFSGQDEALAALDAAGIPCCKVQDEYQAWSNKDFRENGWISEAPTMPDMKMKTFYTRTGNCSMSKTSPEFKREHHYWVSRMWSCFRD